MNDRPAILVREGANPPFGLRLAWVMAVQVAVVDASELTQWLTRTVGLPFGYGSDVAQHLRSGLDAWAVLPTAAPANQPLLCGASPGRADGYLRPADGELLALHTAADGSIEGFAGTLAGMNGARDEVVAQAARFNAGHPRLRWICAPLWHRPRYRNS